MSKQIESMILPKFIYVLSCYHNRYSCILYSRK
eukprot:SAG31_NODE_34113_length_336_cov_0.873418_1_plen_32_part_10